MKRVNSIEKIRPQNFEEKLIWYLLISIYGCYIIGAQPIVVPLIAWILGTYLARKLWKQTAHTPAEERIRIPWTIWLWVIGMTIVLVAIVVAHINVDAGKVRLIRTVLRWGRGWALWALFPLIGCLKIRPKLLYRAVCIVCLQSVAFIIIAYLAYLVGLPSGYLYISPLEKLGGGASDLYGVSLYLIEQGSRVRLALFAPWSPNLAIVALFYFFLSCQETSKKWRWIGMSVSTMMIFGTISRSAILCFPIIIFLTWALTNFTRPILHFSAGIFVFISGIFAPAIFNFLETSVDQFNRIRADSSSLRITLMRMSLDSWWREARIWGHGFIKQEGPAYTYFFPLGTSGCGTWVNVLYTKGIVGFVAIFIPVIWTFIALLLKAQKHKIAKTGLSIFLVFLAFSLIEELDTLAYIYWPGLLAIGMALKEEEVNA